MTPRALLLMLALAVLAALRPRRKQRWLEFLLNQYQYTTPMSLRVYVMLLFGINLHIWFAAGHLEEPRRPRGRAAMTASATEVPAGLPTARTRHPLGATRHARTALRPSAASPSSSARTLSPTFASAAAHRLQNWARRHDLPPEYISSAYWWTLPSEFSLVSVRSLSASCQWFFWMYAIACFLNKKRVYYTKLKTCPQKKK